MSYEYHYFSHQGRGTKKAGKRGTNKKGSKKAGGTRSKSGKASGMMIRGDDLSQKIYATMDKHKEVCKCVHLCVRFSPLSPPPSQLPPPLPPRTGLLCGSAPASLSL